MPLSLYNDLTHQKEIFTPLEKGKVRFYVCGPTVYDYIHVGNARPFILFDILRRHMEDMGYEVVYVQNFTDIDDKMINKARDLGISVDELAERFITAYFEDADALGIRRATMYPRATHYIPQIIKLVERLIERGHAYVVDGDVYFDVLSFPGYGRLSKQSLEELLSGARVEIDPKKRHPLDFALWKAQKPGEPAWDSPWGMGRPGWHIECSAMAIDILGETIDIHAGGSDLLFPHHENEIAQAEAATGKAFVRYWIHNGYLLIEEEKMSKSLGNIVSVREAMRLYSPLAIRLFMLSAHYRSPLSFSGEALNHAVSAAGRLQNGWKELSFALQHRPRKKERDDVLRETIEATEARYEEELNDDFNTAGALGAAFDCVRAVNSYLAQHEEVDEESLIEAERFLARVDRVMGIIGIERLADIDDLMTSEIERFVSERERARKAKDFKKADAIREELAKKGIILEDTPHGTRWSKAM
ncbi:MAG TPA: cysteine--tRNA ligase [Thermosynergistes sp.]|nr:cysteine--tRNA ligase [Thermosynergistes sp.]HXK89180.1 cysteine--tRNA ligase [Thermosynergistes sp.]